MAVKKSVKHAARASTHAFLLERISSQQHLLKCLHEDEQIWGVSCGDDVSIDDKSAFQHIGARIAKVSTNRKPRGRIFAFHDASTYQQRRAMANCADRLAGLDKGSNESRCIGVTPAVIWTVPSWEDQSVIILWVYILDVTSNGEVSAWTQSSESENVGVACG